jgi:hypothetical protein
MNISGKNKRKMNMTSRLGLTLSRITDFGKWEFSHNFNQDFGHDGQSANHDITKNGCASCFKP